MHAADSFHSTGFGVFDYDIAMFELAYRLLRFPTFFYG